MWGPESIIIDPGILSQGLLLTALPAFIVEHLILYEFKRTGVNEVYTFMISMPPLVAGWFYVLGRLFDSFRKKAPA